jgi:hypothetical protein
MTTLKRSITADAPPPLPPALRVVLDTDTDEHTLSAADALELRTYADAAQQWHERLSSAASNVDDVARKQDLAAERVVRESQQVRIGVI